MASENPKVFISYSHDSSDHAERVLALSNRLRREGLDCNIDQYEQSPLKGWPDWMQDEIEAAEFVLVICTEIYHQRFRKKEIPGKGKGVKWEGAIITLELYENELANPKFIPVVFSNEDIQYIPKLLSGATHYNLSTTEGYENLYRRLTGQPKYLKPVIGQLLPMLAHEPKTDFFQYTHKVSLVVDTFYISRPNEMDRLVALLLSPERVEQKLITALWGGCGYGKTTLASRIYEEKIQEKLQSAFPGGVFWVALENSQAQGRIQDSEGNTLSFTDLQNAIKILRSLEKYRKSLIVIDNLWEHEHLQSFFESHRDCALLVTTDDNDTLPENFHEDRMVKINEMELDEAVELLKVRVKKKETELSQAGDKLLELAKRLDRWPLLLNQASRYLASRIAVGYPPSEAVDLLNEDLDENGLAALDTKKAFTAPLESSVNRLKDLERMRLNELAVFPKGVSIAISVIEKYWASTGGMKRIDVRNLCIRFYRLSLLCEFDPIRGTIRLYDGISQYLTWQQQYNLTELHKCLLDAHPSASDWAAMPETEIYFWGHLAPHLIGAGRGDELVSMFKDNWQYLARKTSMCGSDTVEDDLYKATNVAPTDDSLRKLHYGYADIQHLFNQHKEMSERDVKATLFARLQHLGGELIPMLDNLEKSLGHPYITFQSADDRAEDQSDFVISGSYNPVRKWFVAALADHTLKIWDTQTGKVIKTLKGHSAPVNGCAFNHDGTHIVSASADRTLRIWDVDSDSDTLLPALKGHTASVNGCAFSPDGSRIVSASSDETLIVWDALEGKMLHPVQRQENDDESVDERQVLIGHDKAVNDCAFSSDGSLIVSASDDGTLKIWNAETGKFQATLQNNGHSGIVKSCAFSDDGRWIVSASSDRTLRIWNVQTREVVHRLERHEEIGDASSGQSQVKVSGHLGEVNDCAFSPDGKLIVSASDDGTIKVWDVASEQCLTTFYDDRGMNCCVIVGEMIIAGGERGVYFLKLVWQSEEETSWSTTASESQTGEML